MGEVAKARRQAPQREIDRSLDAAAREEITRLEALAQKTLQANPYCADADENEETAFRELAHASRQLRPLFGALAKADDPDSEYARYGHGFRFRLLEAVATIAEAVEYERLHRLHQRRRGRRRKKAVQADAFDDLALECISKLTKHMSTPPAASVVWSAMISQINRSDSDLSAEEDGARIVLNDADGRTLRSIAKSSFPTIFSRLKRKG